MAIVNRTEVLSAQGDAMGAGDILDPRLAETLGSAAAALRAWGAARGLRWLLDRRLTEGWSGATVAFVFERDLYGAPGGARASGSKLLLKLDSIPDVELTRSEFARQRAALRDAPAEFARRHLTELAPEGHDLVPVGDGRWIMFQKIAAAPLGADGQHVEVDDLDVLSKALASVSAGGAVPAGGQSTEESVSCSPEAFVGFCAAVIRAVLRDWAGPPDLAQLSAAGYLREHVQHRLDEGRPLHVIAGRLAHDWLLIDRDLEPNPFILLREDGPAAALQVTALLGPAHGDLHTGNILTAVNALAPDSPFRLIDLAKYQATAPLARDPADFLLFITTRVLRYLDESGQEAIGRLLLCPDEEHDGWAELTPVWLAGVADSIRAAAEGWARQYVQLADWRPQWRLSLAGCALILLSRPSTRVADRMWLLRVAARATRAVLPRASLPARTGVTTVTPEMLVLPSGRRAEQAETWREWFCEYLPRLSRKAADQELRDQLAVLRQAALAGEDRSEEFRGLVLRIDGRSLTTRAPGDADAPVDEVFTCPLAERKCGRVVRPQPADDEPRCVLNRTRMRHEFW
jgi:hypothetical protein